jgi:alkanesulfonate monooxygenase SsuD/methylene tetrahydromethanopterin reductase-like flavin-dependent oxidoreductase (luciferase family)
MPNVREYGDVRLLVDLALAAEAAGWDGCFVWDHLSYRGRLTPVADPWVATAAIAARTERIAIGVLLCALARRRPWKVARETASLDLLSGGRLRFGAGLGSLPDREFADFGEDPDPRLRAARLDEGLEVLSGLWSGEPFEHRGEHYRVRTEGFRPAPVQRPRIPVWIGGRWPSRRPFRRAARWDGVFPTHAHVGLGETMSPAQLAEAVDYTLAHRELEGPFDVVVEGQTAGEEAAADHAAVAAYGTVGLTWWIEQLGWFRGPPAQMRARIEAGPPREAG